MPKVETNTFKSREELFIDTSEKEEDDKMMANARKLQRYDRKRLLELIGFPKGSIVKYSDQQFERTCYPERAY